MRFGIFVVMAGRQAGGPETYEHQLIHALVGLPQQHEYHIFCLDQTVPCSFQLTQNNVAYHVLWPHVRWLSISATLPVALARSQVDLLHATFTPPFFSPTAYVFTMHCFSTFAHPEFYPPALLWRLNKLIVRGLQKARLILCVSENVRDLLAEKFAISPERLAVVYHGVGRHFRPLAYEQVQPILRQNYGLSSPYVLYVGKLDPRKNILRLLEAFHQIRQALPSDLKLVLVGKKTWDAASIESTIERLHLRDHVVELGYVNHQDLPLVYNGATMFVFPSLWEGFGLPVIEAMACGTPVITSNVSCLPEVAGGAAALVDPYSSEELAACMYNVLTDPSLRTTLRTKGLERAALFTWERAAQQTLEAYHRAVDG